MSPHAFCCARCGHLDQYESTRDVVLALAPTDGGAAIHVRGRYDCGTITFTACFEGCHEFVNVFHEQNMILTYFESRRYWRDATKFSPMCEKVYCAGPRQEWRGYDEPVALDESMVRHCVPPGTLILEEFPRDRLGTLRFVPPLAELYGAMGFDKNNPWNVAAAEDEDEDATADADDDAEGRRRQCHRRPHSLRVRRCLRGAPTMNLDLFYGIGQGGFGAFINPLSLALHLGEPDVVFELISTGRLDCANFKDKYAFGFHQFYEPLGADADRSINARWRAETGICAEPLDESALAVRFVAAVEDAGGWRSFRHDADAAFEEAFATPDRSPSLSRLDAGVLEHVIGFALDVGAVRWIALRAPTGLPPNTPPNVHPAPGLESPSSARALAKSRTTRRAYGLPCLLRCALS